MAQHDIAARGVASRRLHDGLDRGRRWLAQQRLHLPDLLIQRGVFRVFQQVEQFGQFFDAFDVGQHAALRLADLPPVQRLAFAFDLFTEAGRDFFHCVMKRFVERRSGFAGFDRRADRLLIVNIVGDGRAAGIEYGRNVVE